MSQSSKDRDKSAADSQRTQVRPAEQNGISIGKGVFATVDIDRLGDVLVIDQPLFALLEKDKLDELCSGCFEIWEPSAIEEEHFERPKACSKCKVVHYCSKVFSPKHIKYTLFCDSIFRERGKKNRNAKERTGKQAIRLNVLHTPNCTPGYYLYPFEQSFGFCYVLKQAKSVQRFMRSF